MDFTQKVFILSDTGIKQFKDDKGEVREYRLISVLGINDLNPVRVSVPLDFNLKIRTEADLNLSVISDYKGAIKVKALSEVVAS